MRICECGGRTRKMWMLNVDDTDHNANPNRKISITCADNIRNIYPHFLHLTPAFYWTLYAAKRCLNA